MSDDRLPSYDELPVDPGVPDGSSWGLWGEGDVFGCLNLLSPERLVAAAGLVRKGAVFALGWDMELPDPPLFGRPAFVHEVSWLPNEMGHDDQLGRWNTQSSSQWDGFRHMRHPRHGFYNGVADEDHGVHHWARRGLAGRAVLLDVARWRAASGRPIVPGTADPIDADELLEVAAAQDVEVRPGDVLLIRTGWVAWYRSLDAEARAGQGGGHLACTGLSGDEHTARVLWDLHVAAVAADNPALEVMPPTASFVHLRLLPLLGLPIGELWDLDALADDCSADGVWEGLFTSAPLNLRSGVASPPNALVLK
jgi:kynurenine formamidase